MPLRATPRFRVSTPPLHRSTTRWNRPVQRAPRGRIGDRTMARILVVDDEPDVLLLFRVNLQHAGHDVLEASDGEQGLAVAMAEAPDAIVLDLMLPLMDGYGVLEHLLADERTRDIPVLVLTAKAQREDRVRCWEQ